METEQFELTPEHQGMLAALALETGKPIPVLLSEALEELQEHVHGRQIRVQELRAAIRTGMESGGATPLDMSAIKARGRERLAAGQRQA